MKKSYVFTVLVVVCLIVASFFIGKNCDNGGKNQPPLKYTDVVQSDNSEGPLYVIGHKSPDTDTVVAAITYANLKNKMGINCIPTISGKINNETKFVLERFNVPIPEILDNAAGKRMILVDHSTTTQMIDGMKDAYIVELLDHHGLGDVTATDPLYIKCMPIGSTATVIYTSYIENEIPFDQPMAGLLLSAILSDTNYLSSTTTTDADRKACEYLSKIAQIRDLDAYYAEMKEHAESYDGMTDEEIFYSDYKEYIMGGLNVGIACVNASEGQRDAMCSKMDSVMREIYEKQEMQHLYALIYDAYNNQSILLQYGDGSDEITQAAFSEIMDEDGNIVFYPSASRKKDVVPPLERAYANR